VAEAMTSNVNKHGDGTNDLSLPHPWYVN